MTNNYSRLRLTFILFLSTRVSARPPFPPLCLPPPIPPPRPPTKPSPSSLRTRPSPQLIKRSVIGVRCSVFPTGVGSDESHAVGFREVLIGPHLPIVNSSQDYSKRLGLIKLQRVFPLCLAPDLTAIELPFVCVLPIDLLKRTLKPILSLFSCSRGF